MFEKKPDATNNLNDLLRQNPFYARLADAVTEVVRRLIDEPRWKLQRMRHHTVVQRGDFFDTPHGTGKVAVVRKNFVDENGNYLNKFVDTVEIDLGGGKSTTVPLRTMPERDIAANNNIMLGFDYFSDSLDDSDMQRIMRYVTRYWPRSGAGGESGDFINFLGFVKRMRFEMHQLWTPDFGNPDNTPSKDYYMYLERHNPLFEEKMYERPGFGWDKETPPEGFGGVYPTSHVELEYDALKYQNIDSVDITALFYFLAPIHLVLERYVQSVYAPQFNLHQTAVASIDRINFAQYVFTPDAELTANLLLVASMDKCMSGVLGLDADFDPIFPLPEGS